MKEGTRGLKNIILGRASTKHWLNKIHSLKQKKKQQNLSCVERKVKEDVWTRVTFPRHPSFLQQKMAMGYNH